MCPQLVLSQRTTNNKGNSEMNTVLLIGRILFALMFVSSGINHLTKSEAMTGYAGFKKVPAAKLSVLISGVLLAAGGLSVILGVYADLGALVLAVLLILIALKMHDFWAQTDAQAKQNETIAFFKNISMAGGALIMFAIAATEGSDYGWTLTDSLWQLAK
ncbi:MAG: DoxX family protein [Actinomycetota bacterium]|nr:DoxX family protein [Actinomycetota bacterium]